MAIQIGRRSTGVLLVLTTGAMLALPGQQPGAVPIRALGPLLATRPDSTLQVDGLRALSDGRVLVNNGKTKQVLLYSADLATVAVVADTTTTTARAYGKSGTAILPFYGDSTLFVDGGSLAITVIDPAGKLARTFAIPRPGDASLIAPLRPAIGGTSPTWPSTATAIWCISAHSAQKRAPPPAPQVARN